MTSKKNVNETENKKIAIVFDEIDAICRARGGNSSGGANVNDLMVN